MRWGGILTIPDSVKTIGEFAFSSSGLLSMSVPNGVTNIGDSAFYYCYSLRTMAIGSSVSSIANSAFEGCHDLASFSVDASNVSYSSFEGVLFDKDRTMLVKYPVSKYGEVYIIPSGVTTIGDLAFSDSFLTRLTVPATVKSIGAKAFSGCYSLNAAYFQGNPPTAGTGAFALLHNVVHYLSGTVGWGATYSGRPALLWDPEASGSALKAGQFGFSITASEDIDFVVEACEDLSHPVWFQVAISTVFFGSSQYSDPSWTNHSSRFYRFRSP